MRFEDERFLLNVLDILAVLGSFIGTAIGFLIFKYIFQHWSVILFFMLSFSVLGLWYIIHFDRDAPQSLDDLCQLYDEQKREIERRKRKQ